MKIIERGQIPEDKPVRGKCSRCRTVVEFAVGEAETSCTDPRDGSVAYGVTCPVCGAKIYA